MKRTLLIIALFALLAPAIIFAQSDLTLEDLAEVVESLTADLGLLSVAVGEIEGRVDTLDERLAALEDAIATPTATPTPTTTPSPEPTATPAAASFTVDRDAVNLRSGPGIDYAVVGIAKRGQEFRPDGYNQARDWLRFSLNGEHVWIYAPLTVVENGHLIAMVNEPTPPPTATPTPPSIAEFDFLIFDNYRRIYRSSMETPRSDTMPGLLVQSPH